MNLLFQQPDNFLEQRFVFSKGNTICVADWDESLIRLICEIPVTDNQCHFTVRPYANPVDFMIHGHRFQLYVRFDETAGTFRSHCAERFAFDHRIFRIFRICRERREAVRDDSRLCVMAVLFNRFLTFVCCHAVTRTSESRSI
jgi:hypothetical protein